MRFIVALAVAAFGLTACSGDEGALQEEAESAEVEAEPEPDPEPQADEVERRPSAQERREATLERQRQEREAQQESQPAELLTVEATTSDLSNFGSAGDRLTLTFSAGVSEESMPVVRFATGSNAHCFYTVECEFDDNVVTMTWTVELDRGHRDLSDASVTELGDTTDVNGLDVQVSEPVPVTEPKPEPESLPDLTQEIAQQELADVAQRIAATWLDGASDFRELDEELMTKAQRLVDEHAPLEAGDASDDWRRSVIWVSEVGVSELGGDWSPHINFTAFSAIGIPGVPATIFGGAHEVGDEWAPDVAVPGTYVTFDVEGCYWERLDNTGSIIANNFIRAAPRVEVTINSSDFAFNSERCGRWAQIDF